MQNLQSREGQGQDTVTSHQTSAHLWLVFWEKKSIAVSHSWQFTQDKCRRRNDASLCYSSSWLLFMPWEYWQLWYCSAFICGSFEQVLWTLLEKYWCILQRTIMITFGMMFLYLTDPYDLCICSENLDSFKPCSGFTCGSFKQNKILGKVIKSYATGYSHLPCITIKSRMNLSFSCLRLLTIELSNLAMLSSVIPPDKYLT